MTLVQNNRVHSCLVQIFCLTESTANMNELSGFI